MDQTTTIRGVLFDSADVLVRPVAPTPAPSSEAWRRWFPGSGFHEIVGANYPELAMDGLDDAIATGMAYLDKCHLLPISSVDEERKQFAVFYRIVLENLGIEAPSPSLTQQLADARVDGEQMEPFPEVGGVLTRLRANELRLGILSEAWPSLETNYERLGLRHLFDAFVISAREAHLKSAPALFETARDLMALPTELVLFVDDDPPYVEVAIGVGFQGAVLAREPDIPVVRGLRYLSDLTEVEALVLHDCGASEG